MARKKLSTKKEGRSKFRIINSIAGFIASLFTVVYYTNEGVITKILEFLPALSYIAGWIWIVGVVFFSLFCAFVVLKFSNWLESHSISRKKYIFTTFLFLAGCLPVYFYLREKPIQAEATPQATLPDKSEYKEEEAAKEEAEQQEALVSLKKEAYIFKLEVGRVHFSIQSFSWKDGCFLVILNLLVGGFFCLGVVSLAHWLAGCFLASPQKND